METLACPSDSTNPERASTGHDAETGGQTGGSLLEPQHKTLSKFQLTNNRD